ncbi:MAG: serine/threonine protein kinase [Myxococcales bacterium]|nr:serine/threonine protein kinase [Myxococcales bacterium]
MLEETPSKIGRYSIVRKLGEGAMGCVYLAEDGDLDRRVALKTIKARELDPERRVAFLERFRNEARAAAKLHHPHIVHVYDVGLDPEVGPYLVFEYVPGATLKQVLRKHGPLEPAQLTKLARQMAEGLAAAHSVGIIHRDLKPDNLLITENGDVKLADFGVARLPDAHLTREGQFLGTPCYAAPETLTEGRYGEASDLYSMAAVLYEAACGKRAFPGDDAVGVAHRVVTEMPPPPSEVSDGPIIPEGVDEAILAGLAKRPEDRPASPHALARAIREAYVGADVLLPETRISEDAPFLPASAAPTPPPSFRRKHLRFASLLPWLVMGLGTIAFAIFGLGVFSVEESSVSADASQGVRGEVGKLDAEPPPLDATPPLPDAEPADAEPADAESDAEPPADAEPPFPDAEAPPSPEPPPKPAPLDPIEREELAKEAIFEVRRAIAKGQLEKAEEALDRAAALDPGLKSIAELRAEIARRRDGL